MTRSHSDCFRNHSVDLKRRPPKSRPTAFPWRIASPTEGGPQGLRRPRFSFFRFTCQTARNRKGPYSPDEPESRRSHRPRLQIGRLVTVISEELRRRAIAPSSGAPCGGYIGEGPEPCQPCPMQILSRPRTCENRRAAQPKMALRGRAPRSRAQAADCRTAATIFTPL